VYLWVFFNATLNFSFLSEIKLKYLGRAIAQAVGHRLLTVESRFQSRMSSREICSGASEHILIHKLDVSFLIRHLAGLNAVTCVQPHRLVWSRTVQPKRLKCLFHFIARCDSKANEGFVKRTLDK
jgi:hypothetical protein